jgi:trans-4-hydroxy-L-proline dehydratase
MIKEVEERQMALDMRLPNAPKLYFYEASLIVMRAIIRLAHRYAELAGKWRPRKRTRPARRS